MEGDNCVYSTYTTTVTYLSENCREIHRQAKRQRMFVIMRSEAVGTFKKTQ